MNENTDHLKDDAFMQQIIQGARSIQPDASFASNLEQTLMQSAPSRRPSPSPRRMIRMLGTMAAILVLIIVATFNVPSLRAIAQEFIVLLGRAKDDETTGYYTEQPPQQLFASLEKAEADLGRKFVVPHYLPSITKENKVISVKFQMLYYTPELSSAQIRYGLDQYSRWSISFTQAPAESQTGRAFVGASAEVETVTFNFRGQPVSGQFVNGGWVPKKDGERPAVEMPHVGEVILETATPPPLEMEWSTESGDMYLIWEADGIIYRFITSKSQIFEINRDELIRIAESIE